MTGLRLDITSNIRELVPYPPGKPLEELEREYGIERAVKLASNENPLGPSPKAVDAIKSAALKVHRYPDGSGYYLKKHLASIWKVDMEQIILGNGSNELIQLLVQLLVGPGKSVISSEPSFLVYRKVVQAAGGTNTVIPLKEGGHDLEAIGRAVSGDTRLIFIDNPNNPMGSVIQTGAFDTFLQNLPDHVLVVLDEAYAEFIRDAETPIGIDYIGHDPRVLFLRTFSKAYGLSGLRVGYGVMDPGIAQYLERLRQPFNVNLVAQEAALAALQDEKYLEETRKLTWNGLDWFTENLEEMGCRCYPSNTNFLLVDIGTDARQVYEKMLRQGVIIRAMNAYGLNTCIRITMGLPEENQLCLAALREVLGHAQKT